MTPTVFCRNTGQSTPRTSFNNILGVVALCLLLLNWSCRKELNEQNAALQNAQENRAVNTSRPNIIIFLADDFGYELPGYTGGESYSTPNLDSMAANGIYFTNAYSHPDGYPSRLAMYTGKYNFRNYTNWGQMPLKEKTIGNMLHDAGYATCFVGKWQCDDGDERIHEAGYDNYRIFLPFAFGEDDQYKYQYKNPVVYENADFLPAGLTNGLFSEDMYTDYLKAFIDSNKTQPFFAVYAHNLPRSPWQPDPDNPDYPAWDPNNLTDDFGDKKYYAGMIHYLDKKIGEVLQKLRDDGLEQNTVIFFAADNATNKQIISQFKGTSFRGGKNYTFQKGIRTPLMAYWPAAIPGHRVDSTTLIDYTDFMPTLANIAGIARPTNYGKLDGITFYDNLLGISGPQRQWSFCHWDNAPADDKQPIRYVFDLNYKLYDTAYGGTGAFYNIKKDVNETKPIPDNKLTKKQLLIKNGFKEVLSQMHQ